MLISSTVQVYTLYCIHNLALLITLRTNLLVQNVFGSHRLNYCSVLKAISNMAQSTPSENPQGNVYAWTKLVGCCIIACWEPYINECLDAKQLEIERNCFVHC